MKRILHTILLLGIAAALSAQEPKKVYPERWVYAGARFDTDRDLQNLIDIARTSAEHGLTAIVLSGMDRISLASPEYLDRLRKFKEICDGRHIEVIPSGFNTGYGLAILSHDKNLAEGLAVKGALFVAGKTEARFAPDSPARFINGGFENFEGNRFAGYGAQDEPGVKSFVDTSVFHSGKASMRLENFGTTREGIARAEQEIRVTPYRCYRVSAWMKTENAAPSSLCSIKAYTADHRDLSPFEPPMAATSDWKKVTTAFNSWYADRILLNVGVFEGVRGRVWVDDVEIEEVGLMNVLRREGTPLRVRNDKTGVVYQEGRDFAPIADPKLDFLWTHDMPAIHLLAGGRIQPGTRLRVDYSHGTTIYNDQVCACPSEPRVFAIWKEQIPLIEKHLAPRKYFLSLDEIRIINRCETCKRRNMTPAAILGDVTNRIYNMIRSVNPDAEIFVWSDMYDPNHNSVPKFYLVDGDLTGTWKSLPRDMGVVCWDYEVRRPSLDFFSSHGFKTVAAAYYDADDLKNPEEWLRALDATPGAAGIMYTTWSAKYNLLAAFGDLVSKRP